MLSPWPQTTRTPNWTRSEGHAHISHRSPILCAKHPALCWAGQQSGGIDWDLRPGAILTGVGAFVIRALPKRNERGRQDCHLAPVSFVRKRVLENRPQGRTCPFLTLP